MGQCFTLVKLFHVFLYISVVRIVDYILVYFAVSLPFV